MLRYLLSIFQKSPEDDIDLSLEESCDILKQDALEENDEINTPVEHNIAEENSFSIKTGIITACKDNLYIIDNLYSFEPESEELSIGCKVSYHKVISEGKIHIYNVNVINKDWDDIVTQDSITSTRVIICQVEKRNKRNLILSPGDITVDLNKTAIEFIPLVGDWLQLDIKYAVNENALDLSGQVIEINKIAPIRPHIETGKVTAWNAVEQCGILNKNVYFNKDSLSCGYIPIIGDTVVAEVIESDQNHCVWRALKLIPEYVTKKLDELDIGNKGEIEENHSGLDVTCESVCFSKLNETKQLKVSVKNISSEQFVLLCAEFTKSTGQCKVLTNFEKPITVVKDTTFDINCECIAKNIGKTSEFLLLIFEDFNLGKWVSVNVNLGLSTNNQTYMRAARQNHSFYDSENQLIRGQRKNPVKRFQSAQLPNYPVPKRLLDTILKYDPRDKVVILEELKLIKPALFTNLTHMNYEDRFHTLLHLDEIANLICIKSYDQEKACFIVNGEYLMLEIENLAERRPSIVLGDRIIASDPMNISQQDYEGNVHKVGAKHVYLKFSSLFHDKYDGEDYSITVVPGRSAYRRLHHGIHLVARNLGKVILFPTKVVEKEAQIQFTYDSYSDKNKVMSPREAYRRMKQHQENMQKKNESLEENDGKSGLKLEWYNTKLNPKQKDAVINILKGIARPLPYIIFGPPGTGKTVTVIESILQIARLLPESRILVTAPSNSAADLIALRLIDTGVLKPGDLVRLVSFNYAYGDTIPAKLVPYCATASLAKEGTADENILSRNGMTFDCSRAVLGRHKITVATCSSSGYLHSMGFPKGHFTHIIVDEAGQAAEPEVMIPVAFLDKWKGQVILAGDPMQLGPVVLCKIALECGLQESFLERSINRFPYVRDPEGFPDTGGFDPRLVTKLLYNYRSLDVILRLFSSLFYNGDLIATLSDTESPEALLLTKLKDILPKTSTGAVPSIVFHGVNGENYQTADSPSWYNPHEAAQIFYYVNELYRSGVPSENVGIITPYSKQVKEIRALLKEAEFDLPKIGTVEDFQGQEFDVILLSTVRSSQVYVTGDIEHSLGFVSSPRRLNVAISRPKALLVIVGNPNLLCHDTYWRTVIKYCVENGGYTGCDLNF